MPQPLTVASQAPHGLRGPALEGINRMDDVKDFQDRDFCSWLPTRSAARLGFWQRQDGLVHGDHL